MPVSPASQGFDIDPWPAPDTEEAPAGASLIDPRPAAAKPGGADALPAGARAVFDRVRAREDDHFVSSQTHDARLAWRAAFEAGVEGADVGDVRRDDGVARELTTRIDADIARRLDEAPSPGARRRLDEALRTARHAALAEAVRVEHGARVAAMRASLDARLDAIAARAVEAPDEIDGGVDEARALLEANPLLVPAREREGAIARFEREAAEGAVARLVDVDPGRAARLLERPAWRRRVGDAHGDLVDRVNAAAATRATIESAGLDAATDADAAAARENGDAGRFDVDGWIAEARRAGDAEELARRVRAGDRHRRVVAAAEGARRRFEVERWTSTANVAVDDEVVDAAPDDPAAAEDADHHLAILRRDRARRLRDDPAGEAFGHPALRASLARLGTPGREAAAGLIARGLALQAEMGVAEDRRRLLPVATRGGIVAAIEERGDDALARLVELCPSPHRARLTAELVETGLRPRFALMAALRASPATEAAAGRVAALHRLALDDTAPGVEARGAAAESAAEALFARSTLGVVLHGGAARRGRATPLFDRAYEDIEAAATLIARALTPRHGRAAARIAVDALCAAYEAGAANPGARDRLDAFLRHLGVVERTARRDALRALSRDGGASASN